MLFIDGFVFGLLTSKVINEKPNVEPRLWGWLVKQTVGVKVKATT